tara:strand:- start:455 stop:748 length:294 start_codon:yes stop_codon:yes gene_type:complete
MDYKIKVITEESTSERMAKSFDKNKESIKAKEGVPPKKKEEPKKDPEKPESKNKPKNPKEKIGKFVKGTYNFVKNRVSDAAGGFGKSSFSEWRDRTR